MQSYAAGGGNSLVTNSAATDVGSVTIMNGTTPQFRAIGMLSATEDPATEATLLGSPSRIGFNSAFTFDFDPGNGIDSGKIDFEGLALPEIGHVLGFVSRVGVTETNPGSSIRLTLFDLFRFRPGVTTATFQSALRILSSGGDQVFLQGAAPSHSPRGAVTEPAATNARPVTGKTICSMEDCMWELWIRPVPGEEKP